MSKKNNEVFIPFEVLNIRDIRRWRQRYKAILGYYSRHYSYFQHERSKVLEELKYSLLNNTEQFEFGNWHRVVTYKYSNQPLSSQGSIVNDPGGRFNIGDIERITFPRFPALYRAENFETAYREKFQLKSSSLINGLTADELSLSKPEGFTNLVFTGYIDCALNINIKKNLKEFFNVIKNIKLPKELEKEAKKLNIPVMYHVKSLKELYDSILKNNWRDLPMQVDIPANSQILGQIANAAGIEAIVYPSTMSSAKKCLAIFPSNFKNSPSYVGIEGRVPDNVIISRLDQDSYLELSISP